MSLGDPGIPYLRWNFQCKDHNKTKKMNELIWQELVHEFGHG